MASSSETVFALAFARNASYDDSWLDAESWELPWPRGVKVGLTSSPKSESLWEWNKLPTIKKKVNIADAGILQIQSKQHEENTSLWNLAFPIQVHWSVTLRPWTNYSLKLDRILKVRQKKKQKMLSNEDQNSRIWHQTYPGLLWSSHASKW